MIGRSLQRHAQAMPELQTQTPPFRSEIRTSSARWEHFGNLVRAYAPAAPSLSRRPSILEPCGKRRVGRRRAPYTECAG